MLIDHIFNFFTIWLKFFWDRIWKTPWTSCNMLVPIFIKADSTTANKPETTIFTKCIELSIKFELQRAGTKIWISSIIRNKFWLYYFCQLLSEFQFLTFISILVQPLCYDMTMAECFRTFITEQDTPLQICCYSVNIELIEYLCSLTLPMPKGRGFLVRRPLRRLRGIGVLHDLPKREFPCAPRYVLFPFMQLWICLPRLCAGCSLQHSHLCRDGFRMLDNPIRGHSNPLSVDSDSHKQSTSDSMGRTYRP